MDIHTHVRGMVSYSCNERLVALYVGQTMPANKSNYHQPLKALTPSLLSWN